MHACFRKWIFCALTALCGLGFVIGTSLAAGLTSEQRKELSAIRAAIYKVHVPVRRDAIDDSEKKTTEAEQRLDAFIKQSGLAEDDSHVASLKKLITGRRDAIVKARERAQPGSKKERTARKEQGVSFVNQIAPIFKEHCLGCHGSEAKGGLRLDTFAGLEKGGKSGALVVSGDPDNSLLMGRLLIPGDTRMPKGGQPLSEAECTKIAEWISRGAKFDGDDPQKPLDKLASTTVAAAPGAKMKAPKFPITKPTGAETVAFTKDIAPILVNSCSRCHSGTEPKGGLSMETFEQLWAGGQSGPVIDPGHLDKSRLWQLAGEQKPFKMPPGDERITRSQWSNLKAWISEGAAFDGSDPKQRLASLVPTDVERRKMELARTSAGELRERRRSRSEDQWRRAFPRTEPARLENDNFVLVGNVSEERLKEAARLAAEGLSAAQDYLGDRSKPAFKGGIAIFVLKDRNSFEEFSQTVQQREAAAGAHGSAVVTSDLKDAYVVVEDRQNGGGGSDAGQGTSTTLLRTNLTEQLATALLKRADKKIPDWIVAGSGRVLAAGGSETALAAVQWPAIYRLVGSLEKPEDLLADRTFSSAALSEVGGAAVAYLIDSRGKTLFPRFVQQLVNGATQADAFRDVYGTDVRAFADGFLARAAKTAQGN
jgi:mono/diheme cytochrome c family protein